MEEKIRLAVFGQKRLSREGGIEIVVKELCTRMAQNGCDITCYNRAGHHVSGAEYDKTIEYDGIRQKVVPTIEKKGLAAVSSSFFAALYNIKLKVNYREYCRQIIKKYSEDDKTEIHIIPHVIDEDNYDSLENDSRVCKLLKKEFPCVVLAPDFKNPIEAKSYISNMDVFIGARMHSTIGAISAGVATIPFSYSKKFEGLFGNLNYPFVISATRIDTDEAVQQTVRYINDKDVLSKAYGRMMPEINDKLENVKKQIKGIMMH